MAARGDGQHEERADELLHARGSPDGRATFIFFALRSGLMPRRFDVHPVTAETWDDFAALVEANNGVWGGCWCMGFHPEGVGAGHTREGNR